MAGQKRSAKSTPSKRGYTLRQRRASMDETRARIMDAALEMYETVGPAATSISAVAARARVTRATLYRHFPTDADLANAVIDEWSAGSGTVDEAALTAIADPTARLRTALVRLYGGYRATEAMTANLLRDAHSLPAERQNDLRLSAQRVREAVGSGSAAGRTIQDGARAAAARAAIGHAVTFETWRSLSGEGLDDAAIVDLMLVLVNEAGDEPRGKSRDASGARGTPRGTKSAAATAEASEGKATRRATAVGSGPKRTDEARARQAKPARPAAAAAPGPKRADEARARPAKPARPAPVDGAETVRPKSTRVRPAAAAAAMAAASAREAVAPTTEPAPLDVGRKKTKGGKGKGGKKAKGDVKGAGKAEGKGDRKAKGRPASGA